MKFRLYFWLDATMTFWGIFILKWGTKMSKNCTLAPAASSVFSPWRQSLALTLDHHYAPSKCLRCRWCLHTDHRSSSHIQTHAHTILRHWLGQGWRFKSPRTVTGAQSHFWYFSRRNSCFSRLSGSLSSARWMCFLRRWASSFVLQQTFLFIFTGSRF